MPDNNCCADVYILDCRMRSVVGTHAETMLTEVGGLPIHAVVVKFVQDFGPALASQKIRID